MLTLKEKKALVRLNKALNQPIEESLLAEIAEEEAQEAAALALREQQVQERKQEFRSIVDQLSADISNLLKEEKSRTEKDKQLLDQFATIINNVGNKADEIVEAAIEINEEVPNLTEEVMPAVEDAIEEVQPITEESLIDKASKKLSETVSSPSLFVQPEPPLVSREIKDIQNKIKYLEGWISKVAMTGPGGGEVNFRYLDDVNRSTMTPSNDNWVLEYDAATKKAQFTKDIGPIDSIQFDTTHVDDNTHPLGTLTWNASDRTLNLHHANGVRQQMGQEQYFPPVKNNTGSTITNGTVCMFAGAESDNDARLLIAPMVADGTYPSLYVMGIATEDIANGAAGFVTSFGYVNDVDTSGWNLGDILYADPITPGGLTNVKPTAPNNVIPVAAVVRKDSLTGRIMVRPTVEQKMLYARFSDTTDQVPLAIETPYPITFNTTEVARGFHVDGGGLPTSTITCEESGYYQVDAALSLTSTNSSAKAFYVWLRKNGVDFPNSAKRQSVVGNGTYQILNYHFTLSLAKNDTIELMYAASDTTISINSPAATAFCPAIPSVTCLITQVAL